MRTTKLKLFGYFLSFLLLFSMTPVVFAQDTEVEDQGSTPTLILPSGIPAQPEAADTQSPPPSPEAVQAQSPDEQDTQTQIQTANPPEEQTKGLKPQKSATKATALAAAAGGSSSGGASLPNISNFSGAATYSIPIEVPPGRHNMAPALSLNYNSNSRNSWLGVGWDLDMGSIERSTKFGLNYGANDYIVKCNGSSSELVLRPTWGPNYYGAKIEEAFNKYYYNTTTAGWEMTSKDGTKYYYGSLLESRQTNTNGTFKWCLDKVEDTNGNYMTLSYTKDQGEIYLDRIDYAGHAGLVPSTSNYVKFYLEDRTDKPRMYTSNAEVVTAKRLKSIEVRANSNLVRAYKLEYVTSESTSRSILHNVQKYGSDAQLSGIGAVISGTTMPGIEMEAQDGGSGDFSFVNSLPGASSATHSYMNTSWGEVHVGDWNGDGKMDMLHLYPNPDPQNSWVALSDGDGTFTFNNSLPGASLVTHSYMNTSWGITIVGDWNGDGKSDLARLYPHPDPQYSWVALSDGDGTFTFSNSLPGASLATHSYMNTSWGEIHVGDFNGDGKTDFLHLYPHPDPQYSWVALSNGDGTFTFSNSLPGASSATHSYMNTSWGRTITGDWNGDGKTDLLRLYPNPDPQYSWVALSNGDGTFTFSNSLPGASFATHSYMNTAHGQPIVGDFNGDGKTDFAWIYPNPDPIYSWVALSNGDGTFNFQNSFPSFSFANHCYMNASYGQPIVGDFNGDGKTDFAWIYPNPDPIYSWVALSNGDATFNFSNSLPGTSLATNSYMNTSWGHIYIGDWSGDGKTDFLHLYPNPDPQFSWVALSNGPSSDLLSTITNGTGSIATINYIPSSRYQNALLPFIVHTVSSITVNDGLGNQSGTTYTYQGGLYNVAEREFRGFQYNKQTNPDLSTQETWFHQDKFFQGRAYQSEFREPNGGALLSKVTMTWDKTFFDPPNNTMAFVKLAQKRTEQYDAGTLFIQEDNTYDDSNGNMTVAVTSGSGAETITKTVQYQNLGSWLWRTSQETVTGSTSGKVREIYYTYYADGTGNLHTQSSWLQGGTNPGVSMTYDHYGNVVTSTDPKGYVTSTEYENTTYTYPKKITLPRTGTVDHILEYGYNYLFGQVAWSKDENNNVTQNQYDVFGRPTQVDGPDGSQTKIEYYTDVFPRYTIVKVKENALGSTIKKYEYVDGLGRPIQTITFGENNKSIVKRLFYDNMGRVWLTYGPYFAAGWTYPQTPPDFEYPWMQTSFDYRGRPTQILSPHGDFTEPITTSFAYSGFSTLVTGPDGRQMTEKKDYLGRVIEVIEHAETEDFHTYYTYNAAGNLKTTQNHYGKTTTINYDTLGRKTDMQDPDMGYWQYWYDANGNLTDQLDAKTQLIHFDYDALDRPLTKEYTQNGLTIAPTVTYVYDNLTISNGRGKVYSITKGTTATTYNAYDQQGRNLSLTKTIDSQGYTTQIGYDLSGKVLTMTYPDGSGVAYTYYPGTTLVNTVSGTTTYAGFSDYEPSGKIGQIDYGNGTATKYTYDAWSTMLFGIVTEDPSHNPANDLQNRSYHYTKAGNIDRITDHLKNITYNYTYDKLHRLKTESNSNNTEPLSLTYNAIGNIMSMAMGSQSFSYTAYDPNHVHGVKTIRYNNTDYQYTYDANGNMISGPDFTNLAQIVTRTMAYDPDNMPVTIQRGSNTVQFVYDGNSQRSKKTVQGGSTTLYIGDHYEVKDGVVTKFIFAGNLRLVMVKNGNPTYFHKDHLGSTVAQTNASGVPVETAEYRPFGTMRSHTGSEQNNYKFTDQEFDLETGLYNYNARLYDPMIGRFISPDTVVPGVYNPQAFNRYSYCNNNPLAYTDPDGHFGLRFNVLWFRVEIDPEGITIGYSCFQGRYDWKHDEISGGIGYEGFSVMLVYNLETEEYRVQAGYDTHIAGLDTKLSFQATRDPQTGKWSKSWDVVIGYQNGKSDWSYSVANKQLSFAYGEKNDKFFKANFTKNGVGVSYKKLNANYNFSNKSWGINYDGKVNYSQAGLQVTWNKFSYTMSDEQALTAGLVCYSAYAVYNRSGSLKDSIEGAIDSTKSYIDEKKGGIEWEINYFKAQLARGITAAIDNIPGFNTASIEW